MAPGGELPRNTESSLFSSIFDIYPSLISVRVEYSGSIQSDYP